MNINKGMIGYFIYGINAIVDLGKKITVEEIIKIIEENKIIDVLIDRYSNVWDWSVLQKYSDNINNLLNKYVEYIEYDSYRKYGIENNGFLILSSVLTQIIVNGDLED